MADRYLQELVVTNDGFTLEEGGGVLILEFADADSPMPFVGGGYYPEQG